MDSLPSDVRAKLEAAIATVVQDSKPEDILTALADALKPPAPTPIDTRSADAFNTSMMQAGIAAMHVNLIGLGDELGYFRALIEQPMTFEDLAKATSTDARYTKEWCITMTAGKMLDYRGGLFSVPPHLVDCLKVEQNPAGLIWGAVMPAAMDVRPKQVEAFKTGCGIDWLDRDVRLVKGTCNFFKPLYEGMLVTSIPEDISKVLEQGGSLADIGCGQGLSSCLIAKAFPKAQVHGVDYSPASIKAAQEMKAEWGLTNVDFVMENAKDFSYDHTYDVTCFLDCFHDMSVASAAAKRAYEVTKPGGYCFMIEPMAAEEDVIEDQVALPTAPMFGAFSCHVCLCCSKHNNGDGLGTLCPTSKHRELFLKAGYNSLESIDSPVNAAGFRFLVAKK